MVWWPGLSTT